MRAQTAADGARGHATIFAGLGARHQDSLNPNFAPTYRAKRGIFFSFFKPNPTDRAKRGENFFNSSDVAAVRLCSFEPP